MTEPVSQYLRRVRRSVPRWTVSDWKVAAERVGGPQTPWLILAVADQLRPKVLRHAVAYAWCWSDDSLALRREDWITLWRRAGYSVDGRTAEPPSEPVALWRGSMPPWHNGMSWTTNRATAEAYVTRWDADAVYASGRRVGMIRTAAVFGVDMTPKLYAVQAPPTALLGQINWRGEDEYVVDTTGLTIRLAAKS